MPFVLARITPELLNSLDIPVGKSIFSNRIAYCTSTGVAVVEDPLHHSLVPDCSFTLWSGSVSQKVWLSGCEASVSIGDEKTCLSDKEITDALSSALLLFLPERNIKISIYHRKPTVVEHRSAPQIMAILNKITEEFPPHALDMGRRMFVPLCVAPDELEMFRSYGEQSCWVELSDAAREFVRESLELLDAKGNERADKT